MNILVTGKGGKAGSWRIRGEQLGAAIGATVAPLADTTDCLNADLVVVVKRTPNEVVRAVRKSARPWVWDVVDGWPQPSEYNREQALWWIRENIRTLRPTAMVFGTAQMQADAEFDGPSIVLPHHSWQRYVDRDPVVRSTVQTVAYEGDVRYLGKWHSVLRDECDRRGWQLLLNGDMTQADIGIALRHGGGYPARFWKPGTKLSNLQALGIPALCSIEEGYRSVASGSEFWIEKQSDVHDAFDQLVDVDRRQLIAARMRTAMLTLDRVADQYRTWLTSLF